MRLEVFWANLVRENLLVMFQVDRHSPFFFGLLQEVACVVVKELEAESWEHVGQKKYV
jgi:hypothetical protein